MIRKVLTNIKTYTFTWFFLSMASVVLTLHIFSVHERNLWRHTSGKITYVKEVSDHNFMYTIEYMTQTDTEKRKVRLFKKDTFHPFRGQEVRLKYRKNNIQEFVILSPMKYIPDSMQSN